MNKTLWKTIGYISIHLDFDSQLWKPKIVIIWPFTEKVCWSLLYWNTAGDIPWNAKKNLHSSLIKAV